MNINKKKKVREKRKISLHELLANLFIILVAALGGIRGLEWMISDSSKLGTVAKLYDFMSNIADIQSLGLTLFISSILIFVSAFLKGRIAYIFLLLGGLNGAFIHYIYALASIEGANLFTTYYSALVLAASQLILALVGGIMLWKKK